MSIAFRPFCTRSKVVSLQFVYQDEIGFLFWCQKCARVFDAEAPEARRMLAQAAPTCPFVMRCRAPRRSPPNRRLAAG